MALIPIAIAASRIIPPSKCADRNSIFPCPYGCSSSAGECATTSAYIATDEAATFTMLSSASEKIAAEPVKKYAMNLIVSSAIPTTSDKLAATASLLGTRPSPGIMPYSNHPLLKSDKPSISHCRHNPTSASDHHHRYKNRRGWSIESHLKIQF